VSRPAFELTLTAQPEHIDELGHVGQPIRVPPEVVAPFRGEE
jgi:hypothetical protein